jgi:hypothetical protein
MHRIRLSAALLVVAVLTSCQRPADPLEWRIEAGTPADYNTWAAENTPRMPEALRTEYDHAFHEIGSIQRGSSWDPFPTPRSVK